MCFVVERVGADLCFVEEEKSLQTVLLCKECVNSFVFCCTKKGFVFCCRKSGEQMLQTTPSSPSGTNLLNQQC